MKYLKYIFLILNCYNLALVTKSELNCLNNLSTNKEIFVCIHFLPIKIKTSFPILYDNKNNKIILKDFYSYFLSKNISDIEVIFQLENNNNIFLTLPLMNNKNIFNYFEITVIIVNGKPKLLSHKNNCEYCDYSQCVTSSIKNILNNQKNNIKLCSYNNDNNADIILNFNIINTNNNTPILITDNNEFYTINNKINYVNDLRNINITRDDDIDENELITHYFSKYKFKS